MLEEKVKPLPKQLRADRLTTMPLSCRFGWHQWAMLDQFGSFAYSEYQRKQCLRCARHKWARIGYEAR